MSEVLLDSGVGPQGLWPCLPTPAIEPLSDAQSAAFEEWLESCDLSWDLVRCRARMFKDD